MTSIDVGFLTAIPVFVSIVLVLKLKEINSSLLAGIITGAIIYTANVSSNPQDVVTNSFGMVLFLMIKKLKDNVSIILILCMVGSIGVLIIKSGGPRNYAEWAERRIKTKNGAILATSVLGIILFIDDYFNCLVVGAVMRRILDKFKVSRAKLAYILDATAAPICVVSLTSSWGASIISQIGATGLDGLRVFMQTVPYNLYAMLTVIMLILVSWFSLDFGLMEYLEREASLSEKEQPEEIPQRRNIRGKIRDFAAPIVFLVFSSALGTYYISDVYGESGSWIHGFSIDNPGFGILFGCFFTILFIFIYYLSRKILNFNEIMDALGQGIRSMAEPIVILTLSWTLSAISCDLLSLGQYFSRVMQTYLNVGTIPLAIFLIAAILSFASGTSWGTYGLLIPIIVQTCESLAPELMVISISATLAGAVFGDHCSPISDTTILSSASAMCDHDDHVKSQLPYALLVAVCSGVGYYLLGHTKNYILSISVSIGLLVMLLILLHRKAIRDAEKYKA